MTYRLHLYTKSSPNERPLTFAVRILSLQWNYPFGSVINGISPDESAFGRWIRIFPFSGIILSDLSSTLRVCGGSYRIIPLEERFERQMEGLIRLEKKRESQGKAVSFERTMREVSGSHLSPAFPFFEST